MSLQAKNNASNENNRAPVPIPILLIVSILIEFTHMYTYTPDQFRPCNECRYRSGVIKIVE